MTSSHLLGQLQTGTSLPGACGDRQPLAGTEQCLRGSIALQRTTSSAAAVKSSHFFPLPFKEVPIKSRHSTALRPIFQFRGKQELHHFSRKATIQMSRKHKSVSLENNSFHRY